MAKPKLDPKPDNAPKKGWGRDTGDTPGRASYKKDVGDALTEFKSRDWGGDKGVANKLYLEG